MQREILFKETKIYSGLCTGWIFINRYSYHKCALLRHVRGMLRHQPSGLVMNRNSYSLPPESSAYTSKPVCYLAVTATVASRVL